MPWFPLTVCLFFHKQPLGEDDVPESCHGNLLERGWETGPMITNGPPTTDRHKKKTLSSTRWKSAFGLTAKYVIRGAIKRLPKTNTRSMRHTNSNWCYKLKLVQTLDPGLWIHPGWVKSWESSRESRHTSLETSETTSWQINRFSITSWCQPSPPAPPKVVVMALMRRHGRRFLHFLWISLPGPLLRGNINKTFTVLLLIIGTVNTTTN